MRGRPWTALDDERLRALRVEGLAPTEIAGQLGRSRQAINIRAHALGLPRPTRMRRGDHVSRFWDKVEKTAGCWIWRGTLFTSGYGCFWDGTRTVRAHRFAYRLLVGSIPGGTEIRHTCDTPACVNPEHLMPGSHAQNMGDAVKRGRQARGERAGRARLTVEDVREIKRRLREGESQSALARAFGVAAVTVHWIAAGKTWREVVV